ncbi:MAG TPA: 50S ribosomal protein L25/general stress protein Ctc [Accumulibacter sp.]|uniref:Large ribosomal subunit protein bL25 n=2 Tax=Candidatus Accumulibacter TaxID=327159 RepID=A0A080MBN7_9PROT|nr:MULTISPECIES: 50S ribosomal protein L25/general stress protein Ctc [Candidatus Accumulibacter]KFB78386.1 MAG: General stress protein CTC [Candidatus Accumulibacter cognatus]MBL8401029.1 50S ribosomal protein L25/general stress protein Ctc [Accumulibacter sp.]MBN8520059.1 50S ribosomal protein L25/general stress protein Ctc [Accumulibacter sp.]MBO3710431.1 50S ribosomal protein L25/general stress protein Ctc [Accumulibacter sp.]MCC2869596.1 50S ribosomal protein L25/general stress protein Ct
MKFEFDARKRILQGSGASRRLRRQNRVPAIVYGGSVAPQLIDLDHNEILLNLRKEAFHSSVLTLNIDGRIESVVLRDSQMHPWKPLVLHADFQRVDMTHAIHQRVPLHFINADIAPGVKISGGHVAHVHNDIEVTCLPQDLPAFIEVDLQNLQAGHSIHASELVFPAGVTPVLHGEDYVLVSIPAKKGSDDSDTAEGAATAG